MLDTWRPRFKGKRNNKRGEGRGFRERRVTMERIEKEKGSFVKRGEPKTEGKRKRGGGLGLQREKTIGQGNRELGWIREAAELEGECFDG